jgi:MoaA/NifB/PqqE/SkfB family radical SAM enzyme
VEATTYCNAACVYCPHTVYQDSWANRHLKLETFRKLLPPFAQTRLVYLQGWGEPLLHPDFFTMVAMAKNAGCRVGTTTNGMLLDDGQIRRLVECGLDLVAFSLAGVDGDNDIRRRGTRLDHVLSVIETLNRTKENLGSLKPAIHIAYMLLRSGLQDLERLPATFKGLGVSQVVISTLDFVPHRDLAGETLLPEKTREYEELKAQLGELAEVSKSYQLKIHYQLKEPGARRLICPENVERALFVGAAGAVSPCVYANLPVSGVDFMAKGLEQPYRPLTFGNLNALSLAAIWGDQAYANFRRSFYTGVPRGLCQSCPKL